MARYRGGLLAASYERLRGVATSVDLLFPGHDAGMLQHYPMVSEDVTRLV